LHRAYSEQVEQNQEYALMVVVPEKAKEVINNITGVFSGGFRQKAYRDENYEAGFKTGYEFGSRVLPEPTK